MMRQWRSLGAALALLAGAAPAGDGPAWAFASRLYANRTARQVGDILMVRIVEEAASSKDNGKTSERGNEISGSLKVGAPLVDGVASTPWTTIELPEGKVEAKRTFTGQGTMQNKDTLSAAIACCVTEVLPNGSLLVEGRRTLAVQGERVEMVLAGVVRPQDIGGDNTVESSRVADASITYRSTGTLAANQNKGLLSRLWEWINPF